MAAAPVDLAGSERPAKTGARRLRDVDSHDLVEVTVTLRAAALPTVAEMPSHALTAQEFAGRYGAAPADVQKVEAVLRSFGLTVVDRTQSGRSLRVKGTAAAMDSAFQAGLGIYHSAEQGEFRGREGAVKVPAELDGIVTGVFGLDQRRMARRKSAAGPASVALPLTPADLELRYDFPDNDAAEQTIAIAEFGSPMISGAAVRPAYLPDDVSAFCTLHRRPTSAVSIVPVNITPLTPDELRTVSSEGRDAVMKLTSEVMMDVEIVAALSPKAEIFVYFASFDQKGWIDLLDKAVGGRVVPVSLSLSWGSPEDSVDWSDAARRAINDRLQIAAMLGVTVCVCSGDDGSGDGLSDARAHVDFPASSPFVLSVGGTMLKATETTQREVAWSVFPGMRDDKDGGASGGGVSAVFERPPWQKVTVASVNPDGIDGRIVPDVAALAGDPLYAVIVEGCHERGGGTSAAAPLWASLVARVNAALPPAKRQRFLAPLFYQNAPDGEPTGASACRDIAEGQDNASHPQPARGYGVRKGYDAVTGWGAPRGRALLAALSSTRGDAGGSQSG